MSQPDTEAHAESEPATSPGDTSPAPAAPRGEEKSSPGLAIGLFAAVALVLVLVLAVQIPKIRTQMHFRKLRTGLAATQPSADQASLDALVARGPDLLPSLVDELSSAAPQLDPYRALLVGRLLGPMKGDDATRVLVALTTDQRPVLRANVYYALVDRVQGELAERALVVQALQAAAQRDAHHVSRAYALAGLVRLGERKALWPLIVSLRHFPPQDRHLTPQLFEAIQGALGKDLAFDPGASPTAQISQMKAIEAAYQAQGGEIPAGQDLESILKKQNESPGASPAPTPEGEEGQ